MIYLGATVLEKNIDEDVLQFMRYSLPAEKKNIIDKLRFTDDKYRTLTGYSLLRYLLQTHYGITDYTLIYNNYGKPYIKEYDNLFFNISHSGKWIVCSISDAETGVDVEKIKPFKDEHMLWEVAKLFLSSGELKYLKTVSKSKLYDEFFSLWTAKEALVKCIGCGMGNVQNYSIKNNNCISNDEIFSIIHMELSEEYSLAVCQKGKKEIPLLSIIALNDIIYKRNYTGNYKLM